MIHVTNKSCHGNHSCHICEWVVSLIAFTSLMWMDLSLYKCNKWEWVVCCEQLEWFMPHIWMGQVTHHIHITHVNESCHYVNVTHEKEPCHPNDACHIYEWVVSLITNHICEWVVSLYKRSTWEWVESCKLFMSHEWVVSRITYVTWLIPMCYIYICIHIHNKRVDCRALRLHSVCIYLFYMLLKPANPIYVYIHQYIFIN